jgi:uncharacterized protein (TIGR03067 family)
VGLAPTEDQHLSTAHNRSDPAASIAVATCWWAFRGIYASTLEMWPNGYPVANSTGTQLEKIQGTWELVASEFNGNTWARPNFRIRITNKELTFLLGESIVGSGTINLDETKTPRAFDMRFVDSSGEKTSLGIYELKGNSRKPRGQTDFGSRGVRPIYGSRGVRPIYRKPWGQTDLELTLLTPRSSSRVFRSCLAPLSLRSRAAKRADRLGTLSGRERPWKPRGRKPRRKPRGQTDLELTLEAVEAAWKPRGQTDLELTLLTPRSSSRVFRSCLAPLSLRNRAAKRAERLGTLSGCEGSRGKPRGRKPRGQTDLESEAAGSDRFRIYFVDSQVELQSLQILPCALITPEQGSEAC